MPTEYIAVGISIVTILISVGISYGIMKAKMNYMEQKIEKHDKDHDLLVEVNTKVDMLLERSKE
ncbi:MAG: hypothetical protein IKV10_04240 [Alphaproteobacteria bacterium]|nr:hypothetical protein [Alphaproteobacteria bacterium]MBR4860483.1 hypothetical protein [Alphaproteobacteria bacterium]